MAEFRVKKGKPISCTVTVPGDKSISHRSVMFAALSNGVCHIDGFLASEDCLATMKAFRQMGIRIDVPDEDKLHGPDKPGCISITVHGRKGQLQAPERPIDCGNSGTTMRLMCGLLAGQPFRSELFGDPSLSRRPMRRVIEPLATMGAQITATGENQCCPLIIDGAPLHSVHYTLPVASAQVKSAVLLAGLFAKGKTTVTEPVPTRDHSERMLEYFLVKTLREGNDISIYGGQIPESRDFTVPGDISSAAFWLVAAAAQPGSELHVKNVGLNKTRTGVLQVLTRMGAQITEVVESSDMGEPWGHVVVRGGTLKGTVIEGDEIPNVIDELPILAVAGALATGKTIIKDAHELRVKETDRIAAVANNLRAMGVTVRELYDGMEIEGGAQLVAPKTALPSFGDHRIAMAFAIAGLFAEGETVLADVECVDTSYPGFAKELKRFQTREVSEEITTAVISHLPRKEDKKKRGFSLSLPKLKNIPGLPFKGDKGSGGAENPAAAESGESPLFSEGREGKTARDAGGAEGFADFLSRGVDAESGGPAGASDFESGEDFGTVVAIDGPAASGKSSVARKLAERLGYVNVNSGAMYRAVAWAALNQGVAADDAEAVTALVDRLDIMCGIDGSEGTVRINDKDPSADLNHEAINESVSAVAKVPAVREKLVALQREYAEAANIVMEGRDIGTVVFPQTPYKYYIDASPEVRAQRRQAQGHKDSVTGRDAEDQNRKHSPLAKADGATVIDSSYLTLDQVVDRIVEDLRKKGLAV